MSENKRRRTDSYISVEEMDKMCEEANEIFEKFVLEQEKLKHENYDLYIKQLNDNYEKLIYNQDYNDNTTMQHSIEHKKRQRCFTCGHKGHMQAECCTKTTNYFCTRCQNYGHHGRNCRGRNRNF